ncbi:LLM class flavin-dependent oxidoreductase [Alteromonas pelagimontana]|uniref:Luciferase-like monooxygenase n=1 Tax=Alteromonas pelagimontana TaxID=1858656 RepID=A0A6M4MA73_9ALTE|nr:LLM class flavin-dependent oxidoreductase [Alteromonas pelagimontana]QJR80074.1 LLM class flavin-dependent oxidoreductase [Alteromonas pelagimontana]
MSSPIPFSILDLAPLGENQTVRDAIQNTNSLAITAEKNGYHRVWLAEHHGMRAVASAATSVMLAGVGAVTDKIRIGAGGIMLPNHSPLVIAEQFGTLAAMYPDRVDLGLGRAPGTDMATARALRRNLHGDVDDYPSDVALLQDYLSDDDGSRQPVAIPGAGSKVPLWLLGSSLYSAQLAGKMGLPFSFASHFAPDMLFDAIRIYRMNFTPSAQLRQPYVSAGVMASVADDTATAAHLFTSVQQQFTNLRRSANRPIPRPVDDIHAVLSEMELHALNSTLRYAVVGNPGEAEQKLRKIIEATEIDELILSFPIHDIEQRLHAIELVGKLDGVMQKQLWATQ